MRRIVLIIHNVRSAHNVGSMLRSADGFGVAKVYMTGYSPYPPAPNDERLPHISQRMARAIHKTALGAENTLDWEPADDINALIASLAENKFHIAALEQTDSAIDLNGYHTPDRIALIVGNEVTGIDQALLAATNVHLQIPMRGNKESLNVASAAAVALYHLRYSPFWTK
jgi:23S rRNA (guanosine2251-2'-O)-methyltransferase